MPGIIYSGQPIGLRREKSCDLLYARVPVCCFPVQSRLVTENCALVPKESEVHQWDSDRGNGYHEASKIRCGIVARAVAIDGVVVAYHVSLRSAFCLRKHLALVEAKDNIRRGCQGGKIEEQEAIK